MSDTVMVALITIVGGTCVGGAFALIQALLKIKFDERVHKDTRADKRDERYNELEEKIRKGLDEREATGAERFRVNSDAIAENTKAIAQLIKMNEEQSSKLDRFADSVEKSFNAMNKNTEIMADGVKSVLYDKITVIYDKCLGRCDGGAITSEEEANIEQLYLSYSGLGGNGEGKTMYRKALAMRTVTKDEADRLDHDKKSKFTS